jgi:integrase
MARKSERLTETSIRRAKPGMHCDGAGLYLQVTVGTDHSLRSSWIFRFATSEKERQAGYGRERQMGLGAIDELGQLRRARLQRIADDCIARNEKLPKGLKLLGSITRLSLDEARELAAECTRQRKQGVDPIEARDRERLTKRTQAQLEVAQAVTFDQCSEKFITSHESGWRNAKHRAQWSSTLKTYVSPVFGRLSVQAVDTALVMKALSPIWNEKPETASRIRGRIEAVLDWARTSTYRQGENPARWKGHLDNLLPRRSKVRAVKHHPALPYADVGVFMAALRGRDGIAARALEFTILTATRTSEVLGARWDEIDLQQRLWTVPAERMKASKEHRVPLSAAAVALLETLAKAPEGSLLFPGAEGAELSENAMLALLERMERSDITVHGFRSTFKDWATEKTNFPNIVSEMALAHTIDGQVEAAYRRGELLEKRRKLMEAWAHYCGKPAASTKEDNVVQLRTANELPA